MWMIWIAVLALVALAGTARLAPSDPGRWHVRPDYTVDKDFAAGALRGIDARPGALARLDRIARDWPRTRVLAGSVEEGMITYVTRTKLWGFPDYTTISQHDGRLVILARLRFGRRDFGVNRARIEAWLDALRQGDA